jgi:hypothetical protein
MANPVINTLTSITDTANTATIVSASVSPTAGSLLIVDSGNNGVDTLSSITLGGTLAIDGSWTHVGVDQGGAYTCLSYAKYSTGSGTVTVTFSGKNNRKHLHILEAENFDTTTPVNDSNTASGSSVSPTVSLTAVDTGNTVVGVCMIFGAGLTTLSPDQGIEEYETSTLGPGLMSTMSDETTPGSTVSFTPNVTGTWAVSAIEINAEADPNLIESFTDDLDAWNDDASLEVGHVISESDDLASWLDDENIELSGSDLTDSFEDDLDAWTDSANRSLSYQIAETDDLDSWNDSANRQMDHLLTESDDLAAWLDDSSQIVSYEISVIGDLDNWNDSYEGFLPKGVSEIDSLNNWADEETFDLLHQIEKSDDLADWLDDSQQSIGQPALTESFGDNLANWLDAADVYNWTGEYIYTILLHDTDNSIFGVWKAADPTGSWSFVSDSAIVLAGNVQSYWAFQTASEHIHVVTQESGGRVSYHKFNPATDLWEIADETVDDTVNAAIGVTQCGVAVSVRTDGDIIVLYTDHDGSDASVSYARRESGSWTSGTDVASSAGNDFIAGSIVRGSSDRMHLFYTYDPSAGDNQARHRTLTSANSLQTEQTLDAAVFTGIHSFTHGDLTGTNDIAIGRTTDAASSVITVSEAASADVPSWSHTSVSDAAADSQNGSPVASVSTDGTDLHLLYSRDSDNDLYRDKDTGSGWGADVATQTGVTANRVSTNVFSRGGSTRFAYLWDDAGTVKYGEISLAAAQAINRAVASDLDSWTDLAKLRFRHFLTRSDDLDNWLDDHAKSMIGLLGYDLNDDIANWSDQLGAGHGHFLSDSITFSDGITRYMLHQMLESDAMSFSDSIQKELEYRLTLDDQFTLDDGVVVAIVYLSQFSDTLTLSDAYKLTIGYTLKKGDTLALSDAIKLLYSYQLSLTDTLTMSDGIELFGQILMTQSDAMSLSDFKELLLSHFMTFSDTMTFADGFQKFMDQPDLEWEPSDSMTLSDAIEKFMEHFMTQSDTMTLTDAASVAATLTDEFSDTLTLSDAYSMILAKLIAQSDILSMSDARQIFLEHLLALSDSFTLNDAQVQLVGQLLAYSDILAFTDAQNLLLSHLLNISDTLSLSDASSISIEDLLAESDTLTLSDEIQVLLGYLLQVSDALSMSDGQNVDLGGITDYEEQKGDTLTFSDSFAAILNHFLTKSDTLVVSDGFQIVLSLLIADLSDNLNNWADNIAQAYGFAFQPSDDLTLSDSALLGLRYLITKSDTMTPSDGISMLMLYFLSVSDVMTFTDASSLINGYLKAISDDADNWNDSLVKSLGLSIEAGSDLDVWAQAIAMQLSYWIPIGDGLTLVDGTSRFAEYFLTRSDTLNISDVMVRVFGYLKTLSDDLSNWADSENILLSDVGAVLVAEASDLENWNDSVSTVLGTIAAIIKIANEAFSKPVLANQAITEVILDSEAISEVELSGEDFDSSE